MMLRSSSTPVLGSLLQCCFSESPNNNPFDPTTRHPPPTTIHEAHNKFPLHQTGSLKLSSISCNSSPISPSVSANNVGFRRAQSDGNLKGLACVSGTDDEFSTPNIPRKRRPSCSMLQTIPSFSFDGLRRRDEDEESDGEEGEEEKEELDENDGERFMAKEGEGFSSEGMKIMGWIGANGGRNVAFEEEKDMVGSEMHLARGLGVGGVDFGGISSGGGGGGGRDFTPRGSGGESSDRPGMEEYYKTMVQENPSNPLFLRNYAQFLYQSKHDLQGAEDYLARAILADPKDGEILSQYAKLVWELDHDQDRASSYFERAVQAAPDDSHVHAAYASFLWETEDDNDDGPCHVDTMPPLLYGETMASAVS